MYSCSSLAGLVSSNRRLQWPPNSSGDAEVEADRLGVADVQVAVRLGREARDDAVAPAGPQVGGDDVADEVGPLRVGGAVDAHVAAAPDVVADGRAAGAAAARTSLGWGAGWALGQESSAQQGGASRHRLRCGRVWCRAVRSDYDGSSGTAQPVSPSNGRVFHRESDSSACAQEAPPPAWRRGLPCHPCLARPGCGSAGETGQAAQGSQDRGRPAVGDQRLPRQPEAADRVVRFRRLDPRRWCRVPGHPHQGSAGGEPRPNRDGLGRRQHRRQPLDLGGLPR